MITGQLARELVELMIDLNSWQLAIRDKEPSKVIPTIQVIIQGTELIEPYIGEYIETPEFCGIITSNQYGTRFIE